MSLRTLISVVVLTILLPFSQSFAGAVIEPQILAMIASAGSKSLTCKGDSCSAEFSAFCMEPGRPGPAHDASYRLSQAGAVTLVAHAEDGRQWQLPISSAQFTSQRGYSAVRITVPRHLLSALGAASVTAKIGRRVVLLPNQHPDYVRPHRPAEIAAAVGPNRRVGERLVDRGGKRADGARLLSYLINALPVSGKATPAQRQSLWQVTKAAPAGLQKRGRALAEQIYHHCRTDGAGSTNSSLRECLQHGHDRNMWLLNQLYWQSVGPQS